MQNGGGTQDPPAGTGDPNPAGSNNPPAGQGDPAGGGAGSGGGSTGTGSGGTSGAGDKDPDKLAQALESARTSEKAALAREREAKKAAETAEAELKKYRDAEKSDLEKAQEEATKAQQERDAAQARARALALRYAVTTAAVAENFTNPEDPYLMIQADLDKVEFDEQGEPKGVDELVKKLAKDRPYLLKSDPPKPKNPPTPTPPSAKGGEDGKLAEKQQATLTRMRSTY